METMYSAAPGGGVDTPPWFEIIFVTVVVILAIIMAIGLWRRKHQNH